MARSGRRRLLLVAVGVVVLLVLAAFAFDCSGYFLRLDRQGGDQSQSSPIDLSPAPPSPRLPLLPDAEVDNVILILGDGMGLSHVMAARSELRGLNHRLYFERFPVTGWQTTHSRGSLYSDSASTGSSLATGQKVAYQAVSVSPDGEALTTLFEAAGARGMALGVVTDSYLWDATPAAFLAHVPHRRDLESIARQMAASAADLLIGEETLRLDIDRRPPGGASILASFAASGFEIVRSAEALAELDPASTERLLGLFPAGEITATDRPPVLPDLATTALAHLAGRPNGYLLLIESEEPDIGSHNQNLERIVTGIRHLEAIATLAVERALADRATLVLVTSDHEAGGLALLHGDAENRLGIRFATTSHTAEPVPIYAFGAGAERFGGVLDNTEIALRIAELLGLDLTE